MCSRDLDFLGNGRSRTMEAASQIGLTSVLTCWADIRKLSMQDAQSLCKAHNIAYAGRVTKQDLYHLICQHFGISTSGAALNEGSTDGNVTVEKPTIPQEVLEAYRKFPSFPRITSGWSVAALCKVPFFEISSVKEYLISGADKAYDGESLRCHKQLRAFQLFDERHIHDLEANLWEKGEHFYFVCAKCWLSQDISKAAYKCIVCRLGSILGRPALCTDEIKMLTLLP